LKKEVRTWESSQNFSNKKGCLARKIKIRFWGRVFSNFKFPSLILKSVIFKIHAFVSCFSKLMDTPLKA
jgi:hypothetical protein